MDWYHISIAKSKGKESSVDVDCLDLYPPASLNISSIRVPTEGGFVPVHSPLRHYYIFRNSMLLNRRSSIPLHWKYNNTVQMAFMFAFFTLVTPSRLQHLRKMLRGLWDGLRGRSGGGRL